MLKLSLPPTPRRITQLERPQKVVGLLEIRADCENLMNQILHTLNAVFPEGIRNKGIVGERDSGPVNFTVATFVDEMADGFKVRLAIGDIGLDDLEHFLGCFGEFDEDTIVDLEEAKKLQDFTGLRSDLVDTGTKRLVLLHSIWYCAIPLDADDKDEFGLSGNIKIAFLSRETFQADLFTFGVLILLDIGLGALENDLTLSLGSLDKPD